VTQKSETEVFTGCVKWAAVHDEVSLMNGSVCAQPVTSPKFWNEHNILTLNKQQYFVWGTASQNTKRQDMLEIWGERGQNPLDTSMCSTETTHIKMHL